MDIRNHCPFAIMRWVKSHGLASGRVYRARDLVIHRPCPSNGPNISLSMSSSSTKASRWASRDGISVRWSLLDQSSAWVKLGSATGLSLLFPVWISGTPGSRGQMMKLSSHFQSSHKTLEITLMLASEHVHSLCVANAWKLREEMTAEWSLVFFCYLLYTNMLF